MSPLRCLARVATPLMIGAALVGGAGIAAATPQDDAYLAQLRAAGLTWPPKTEEALIAEAQTSATTSRGVGRRNRSPTTFMPAWTTRA